jgi:hypothetical protein
MPTTQTLLRPSSSGGDMVEAASHIKYADAGGGTTTLQLKIDGLNIQAQCAVTDATGEADNFVTHLSNNRVSGLVKITGHVIQGKKVGFNNLPDDAVLVHAVLGSTGTDTYHLLRFNMAITGLSMQYTRQLPTIPITIEGVITGFIDPDTGAANIKSIHESTGGITGQ